MKQFVDENFEWDHWLELATFSYNTMIHEGTRCTPYELVFGKLARQTSKEPLPEHEKLETCDDFNVDEEVFLLSVPKSKKLENQLQQQMLF